MFVKKGDKVRVIAGKDKGTEAVVLKALPKVNKVIVEGVGMIKNTKNLTLKILKELSSKKKHLSMSLMFKY